MAGGALPRVTRRGRLWRGLWPGRNPLWCTCDRVEPAFAAGLLAAFLIAAPLLALFAGQWAHGNSVRAQRAALAARHLVPPPCSPAPRRKPSTVAPWCGPLDRT